MNNPLLQILVVQPSLFRGEQFCLFTSTGDTVIFLLHSPPQSILKVPTLAHNLTDNLTSNTELVITQGEKKKYICEYTLQVSPESQILNEEASFSSTMSFAINKKAPQIAVPNKFGMLYTFMEQEPMAKIMGKQGSSGSQTHPLNGGDVTSEFMKQ